MDYIVKILAQFLAVMVVITFHEFAHAYAAYKCGDPTAKFSGRMTLNPLKHFDPLGIVMFAFVGFGWAKPVPINPNNFNDYKKGCLWTSAAGVIANYIMAFVFYPVFVLTVAYLLPVFAGKYMSVFLYALTYALFAYSLSFCVFNLLPVYPLDGFRIVDAVNRKRGKVYRFLRQYGYYILLALMFISILADNISAFRYIDVLGYIMQFAVGVFGRPITLFWNWVLGFIL
ncbi:MAG: site-2 protease family protein [Clostridia bacterium]|nr:site-2 protease family protein [Clostridia bacterium]